MTVYSVSSCYNLSLFYFSFDFEYYITLNLERQLDRLILYPKCIGRKCEIILCSYLRLCVLILILFLFSFAIKLYFTYVNLFFYYLRLLFLA